STQVGDCFTLSPEHLLRVCYNQKGEPSPYVYVRAGLEAKLNRSVYYELANKLVELNDSVPEEKRILQSGHQISLAEPDNLPAMGVWSAGKFFIF
ncbi:MAG: hypothetical protein ACI8O8_000836, partial [Oleiphilaceae bacterium]